MAGRGDARTSEFPAGVDEVGSLGNPAVAFDVGTVETDDGALLHVRSYGPESGPIVVLIHGWACRIEYWNPQINALAGTYRVIAYDQRGLGRSSLGGRGVRPEVLGDDLAAVLGAVIPAGRRAVLVGHSFGGISVLAWAQRHPDHVDRLASAALLADTTAGRFRAHTALLPFPGRFRALRSPLLSALLRTPRLPWPPIAVWRRPFQLAAMSRWAGRAEVDFVHAVVASCAPASRVAWAAGLRGLDVLAGVENLTVPTSVVVGLADRLTPPSASRQIAEILRDRGTLHHFVELPRVGHCSNVEAPAVFNAAVAELARLEHPERRQAS